MGKEYKVKVERDIQVFNDDETCENGMDLSDYCDCLDPIDGKCLLFGVDLLPSVKEYPFMIDGEETKSTLFIRCDTCIKATK